MPHSQNREDQLNHIMPDNNHVLHIVHLVEDLTIGGLEKVLATIALNLNRKKYKVSVWCLREGGFFAHKLLEEGIEVKIVRIATARNPINIYRLYKLLKIRRFDIIHTHAYSAGTIGRVCGFLAGIPVIISHNHSVYAYYKKYNHFVEWILSHITDRIVCVSDMVKRFAIQTQKINSKKLLTIRNGIDDEPLVQDMTTANLRKGWGIPIDHPVVCTITHLEEHKGVVYLIKAASLLLKSRENVTFLLVGNGSLKDSLIKLCMKLNIEKRVIFTGERIDTPEILSLIDVFVLPSIREGLGLSILEAMSHGKPIIATKVGGIPEIVTDGVNGILVPPCNPDALVSALETLLKNKEKREQMGFHGKRICNESFGSKAMVNKIELLYDELLSEK
ncbi:MAG: glycosyl transferase family 1 [Candidatus Scalindua sp.]|nr:MAG: glycosyl transferase family 1 [Candidatus Scalindua sp.]